MVKYRQGFDLKVLRDSAEGSYDCIENPDKVGWRRMKAVEKRDPSIIPKDWAPFMAGAITSSRPPGSFPVDFDGKKYTPSSGYWKTGESGFKLLAKARRVVDVNGKLRYRRYFTDFPVTPRGNFWTDTTTGTYTGSKIYVVQTGAKVIERCLLMATDPGDLVLDPTCGSGTTAYVAEQWGRRWITIDTSRVALTLARARIMGARYPWYLLADSADGRKKEAQLQGVDIGSIGGGDAVRPAHDLRQGFVYERVPHVTLKSIANNAEIDEIWNAAQPELEKLREAMNVACSRTGDDRWEEWEIPRDNEKLPKSVLPLHQQWWELRIERQRKIDASIARAADQEFLYDKPYEDKKKVRVAGPFTVESLSPHRVMGLDADGSPLDPHEGLRADPDAQRSSFDAVILQQLRVAGVQQARKAHRLTFETLEPGPAASSPPRAATRTATARRGAPAS